MKIRLLENILKKLNVCSRRQMALFTQIFNPISGQHEWTVRGDNYDYHQEVANAGFGDMLHDWERNQKYFATLRKTIKQMKEEGREVHVLDIGTGTGILAMMATKAGADTVTACEAFLPMANCAERILEANGVDHKVKLIKKRSTDIKIGDDMQQRANLLVTEVLDTELIGEGAISIYNHAHDNLLTDDVICIPARATCYAMVVQSPLASQFNTMKLLPNLDGDVLLHPSTDILSCHGEAAVHDIQLSQLPLTDFQPISSPVEIFEFDFNSKAARPVKRQRNLSVKSTHSGATELVFYWWDIKMDIAGEILLSCAPYWAHPEFKELSKKKSDLLPLTNVVPWRDHWMQAIYFIPKPIHVKGDGTEFQLSCNHDEYSLWFDVIESSKNSSSVPRHSCNCSLHMTYSRSRIGQMNQSKRNKIFLRQLEKTITPESQVLVLGDGCILGLAIAKLGAKCVILNETRRFSRHFTETLAKHNDLNNIEFIDQLEKVDDDKLCRLTHIFAEPYFINSIMPWDNFYFGLLLLKIQAKLNKSIFIMPQTACIYALAVEFLDLHKIRSPIGSCEGFDLTLFDQMIETSTELAQSNVEAQPLWEYPCRALSKPQQILSIDFNNFGLEKETMGNIILEENGCCNGIALWVDWNIGDNKSSSIVSTGPTENVITGQFVKWDMFNRQGVHFTRSQKYIEKNQSSIHWKLDFKPKVGGLKFQFDVRNST